MDKQGDSKSYKKMQQKIQQQVESSEYENQDRWIQRNLGQA